MAAPTIGLAIIARDEEANLPHLLGSIAGAFDQVALLDTGSTDRTVEVFEEWAAGEQLPLGYRLGRFEWCDDFGAARNAADELLGTDWLCWADCDEVIVGAQRLRSQIEEAEGIAVGALAALLERPDHKPHPRIRAGRRGNLRWSGRVHEHPIRLGSGPGKPAAVLIPPHVVLWRASRYEGRPSSRARNARLARLWRRDEPENPRPAGLLAEHELLFGDLGDAIELAQRCIELSGITLSAEGCTEVGRVMERLRTHFDRHGESPILINRREDDVAGWLLHLIRRHESPVPPPPQWLCPSAEVVCAG